MRVRLDKLFPQVFNGQLFFTNTSSGTTYATSATSWAARRNSASAAAEFTTTLTSRAIRRSSRRMTGRRRANLTINVGLRTEFLGAWTDGDCHIGNIESDLTKSGTYPFIYPSCVNKLGVSGLTGNAQRDRPSTTMFRPDGAPRWIRVGRDGTSHDYVARRLWHFTTFAKTWARSTS